MKRLVVQVTRTSIRAIASEGSGAQWQVRQLGVAPLAGELTRELLARAAGNVSAARGQLIVVIPREHVITRIMKFPTVQPDELARMIQLTGKAQLPYAPELTVADFTVLEQQHGVSTVHLVACHREVVERSIGVLRQAGREPSIVTPSSWGLLAWYRRLGPAMQGRDPVLVVNIDSDHTDLALIASGKLVFSRSLTQGSHDWHTMPDGVNMMGQELERSLSSVRKELPTAEVNMLLLTGLGELPAWAQALQQRLGKPVSVVPVEGALKLPRPFLRTDLSTAVLLGLATADQSWLVNLLPRDVRQAQEGRKRIVDFAITGTLVLAAVGLAAALLGGVVSRRGRMLEDADRLASELAVMTKETDRQERNVKAIERVLKSRRQAADTLRELFRHTSGDVQLESLLLDPTRNELIVRGNAPTTREVLDYIRTLEQAGQWARVELRFSSRRNTSGGGSRADFELMIRPDAPTTGEAG